MDPLYLFVFLGLFTPGPNVILITTSGARFGVRASIPHIIGIVLGVGITAGLTGLGIGAVLAEWPVLKTALGVLAAAWILWMALQLWHARPAAEAQPDDKPWGVARAALFQWVNPKLWAITLAAASGYGLGLEPWAEAQRLALAFSGLNLFVCLFWASTGALLAGLLLDRARVACFHPSDGQRSRCFGCHGFRLNWALYGGSRTAPNDFPLLPIFRNAGRSLHGLSRHGHAAASVVRVPVGLFAAVQEALRGDGVMSLVVAAIEIGLIWYMGRVVDLLSSARRRRCWRITGWELILAALFVLTIRPLTQGLDVALLNNAILPQFGTLIRWRAHRQVLRQSVGWFENDFAGRIANRIMQTPPAAARRCSRSSTRSPFRSPIWSARRSCCSAPIPGCCCR
jgi:threonine/homoserine/homoserine lactone efflux protein